VLTGTSSLTARPETYAVPETSTILRIAWHYGKLPQPEFDEVILRALNTVVEIVIDKPSGDSPVDGDKITFRSPSCHVRVTSETRYSLTYGTLATSLRGIGVVMGKWGPTPADILIYENQTLVARVSIEFSRG